MNIIITETHTRLSLTLALQDTVSTLYKFKRSRMTVRYSFWRLPSYLGSFSLHKKEAARKKAASVSSNTIKLCRQKIQKLLFRKYLNTKFLRFGKFTAGFLSVDQVIGFFGNRASGYSAKTDDLRVDAVTGKVF